MEAISMRATLFLAMALAACGNDGNGSDSGGSVIPDDAITFSDANNYSYTGDIEIQQEEVQAGADLTLDWCALTTDIRGRPVEDPSAVDQVLLVEFALSQEEVEARVEANDLEQADAASTWLSLSPGACTVMTSDFSIIGNDFDPAQYFVEDPNRTWLTSVMNTPDGRFDILMSKFIVPKTAGTTTLVTIDDSSATLTVDADLTSGSTLQVAAGDTPYIDWTSVTVDVNGAPYDSLLGNRVLVGKVPVATIEEAEALFLQLDIAAEKLYYLDVYGETSADLSKATAKDGEVFPGFTTDGIWLFGVECLTCISPAPLLLTVVEVSE